MPRKKQLYNKKPDNNTLSGDWSAIKAELRERKECFLADRVEIQAKIISGELILRNLYKSVMGNIYTIYRTTVLTIDESNGHLVSAILGIPEDHKIREIMSCLAYEMIGDIIKDLEMFLQNLPVD